MNTTPDKFEQKKAHFTAAKNYGGIRNLTPHAVTVAGVTYPPSGIVVRVEESYHTDGEFCSAEKGKLILEKEGQPFPLAGHEFDGTVNIVSAMVLEITKDWYTGVWVAPATGHPDVVRNEKGHIVSVPCFRLF